MRIWVNVLSAIRYATSQFGYLLRVKQIPHLVWFLNLVISSLHFSLSKEVLFYSISLHQALFSHWLSTKAKAQLSFCDRYWFVFLFNEVVFRNPLGRKEKVDEFWVWVNKCQDMTTIEVGIWGQAFKSCLGLLTLQPVTEHGIPTGHRMPVHLQKSVVLWDVKTARTWGSSKRVMGSVTWPRSITVEPFLPHWQSTFHLDRCLRDACRQF